MSINKVKFDEIAKVITSFCPNISYIQNVRGHVTAMVDFGQLINSIYDLLWGNTIIIDNIGVEEATGRTTSIWFQQSWEL